MIRFGQERVVKPLHAALPGALHAILREAPLSPGKVAFAWGAVVGPALQRVTSIALDQGRLIVDASTESWAREVERSRGAILRQLQDFLGPGTVSYIDVRTVHEETNPDIRRRRGRRPSGR
jgi:hypothetical protein